MCMRATPLLSHWKMTCRRCRRRYLWPVTCTSTRMGTRQPSPPPAERGRVHPPASRLSLPTGGRAVPTRAGTNHAPRGRRHGAVCVVPGAAAAAGAAVSGDARHARAHTQIGVWRRPFWFSQTHPHTWSLEGHTEAGCCARGRSDVLCDACPSAGCACPCRRVRRGATLSSQSFACGCERCSWERELGPDAEEAVTVRVERVRV
jgi:hypothetical protein